MLESFKVKAGLMGNGDRPADTKPKIARSIVSFSEFKKRIMAFPMEDRIRNVILQRVAKYPEASLDYAWTRLQDFISAAGRELANKSRAETPVVQVAELVELVEEKPKLVEKPKPNFVRPSIDLMEFDIPEGENKDV